MRGTDVVDRSSPATQSPELTAAVQRIRGQVTASNFLTAQSLPRVLDLLDRFAQFSGRAFGVRCLDDVTPEIARRFVMARAGGGNPAPATMHLRRSALRLVFCTARELGLATTDPTLDLALPPRSALGVRPLTDDEIATCRSYSLHTLTSTRPSTAWTLAEASATTAELAEVRLKDVDVDNGTVWLRGSSKVDPRWAYLDPWGQLQIDRRLRALAATDPDSLLIYEGCGSPQSRQASSCMAISETLRRAGLATEPDIRPASVTAWAGARLYTQGATIEEVARRLGRRSLDGTAAFIGLQWRAK